MSLPSHFLSLVRDSCGAFVEERASSGDALVRCSKGLRGGERGVWLACLRLPHPLSNSLAVAHGVHTAALSAPQVTISDEGVAKFVAELDMERFRTVSSAVVTMPLAFDSVDAATNFWVTLNLLNFGSGFRHDLHTLQGRGAYETMVRACVPCFETTGRWRGGWDMCMGEKRWWFPDALDPLVRASSWRASVCLPRGARAPLAPFSSWASWGTTFRAGS
jgi:hypothetical protein